MDVVAAVAALHLAAPVEGADGLGLLVHVVARLAGEAVLVEVPADVEVRAAGRAQHFALRPGLVGLAGDLFDDHRQEQIAEVGVFLVRPGQVGEGTAEEVAGELFLRGRLGRADGPHHRGRGKHRVAALLGEAGLVPQQVLDRDEVVVVVGDVLVIAVQDAERPEDGGVQHELAPLLQLHDAHGRDELRDGRHPQEGARGHRPGRVRPAIAAGVHEGVVPHDGQGNAPERPPGHETVHDGVHRRQAGQGVGDAVVEAPSLRGGEEGEEKQEYGCYALHRILPARRPKSMMQSAVPSMPRMELSMHRS